MALEVGRQLERGLTSELHQHPQRTFGVADVEDILRVQGVEVEAVDRIVVGGNRLGVAVDHHRFVAFGSQAAHRLHAAGVELDALADAHRATAEDEHRSPRRWLLIGIAEAAVEIGGAGLELGRASVHSPPHPFRTRRKAA